MREQRRRHDISGRIDPRASVRLVVAHPDKPPVQGDACGLEPEVLGVRSPATATSTFSTVTLDVDAPSRATSRTLRVRSWIGPSWKSRS